MPQHALQTEGLDLTAWRSKLGYYNLKEEGLLLNGSDERTAFLTVLQAAAAAGREVIHPGGTLGMGSKIVTQLAGLRLRGNGPDVSIIQQNAGSSTEHMIDIGLYGSLFTNTTNLTADANQGTDTVTMSAVPSAIVAGNLVLVQSDEVWPWSDKGAVRGELCIVASKTSTTITFDAVLDDTYTTATTARIKKVVSTRGGLVEGIGLINATPNTHSEGLLRLAGFIDPRVQDVWLTGADRTGVQFEACLNPNAKIKCFNFSNDADNGRYGYGCECRGATRGGMIDVYMRGGRHAFTTGADANSPGIPRHITADVEGTRMTNACADTHPEGDQINLRKVRAYQTKAWGIQMRAPNSTLTDGVVRENVGYACWVRGSNCKILSLRSSRPRFGFIQSVAGDPGGNFDGQGLRIGDGPVVTVDDGHYEGVWVEDSDQECIYIGDSADRHTILKPTLKRPGRGGSGATGVRLSGTNVGNRLIRPRFDNCSLGIFGTNTQTDFEIHHAELSGVGTFLGGTIVPLITPGGLHGVSPIQRGWSPAGGPSALTGVAYYNLYIPERDQLVVALGFAMSTAAAADDTFDLAIYEAALVNRLAYTGTKTSATMASGGSSGGGLNTTGVKIAALQTAITLKAGRAYYPSFSRTGGSDGVMRGANYGDPLASQALGSTAGTVLQYTKSTTHPQPATLTPPTVVSSLTPVIFIREA